MTQPCRSLPRGKGRLVCEQLQVPGPHGSFVETREEATGTSSVPMQWGSGRDRSLGCPAWETSFVVACLAQGTCSAAKAARCCACKPNVPCPTRDGSRTNPCRQKTP